MIHFTGNEELISKLMDMQCYRKTEIFPDYCISYSGSVWNFPFCNISPIKWWRLHFLYFLFVSDVKEEANKNVIYEINVPRGGVFTAMAGSGPRTDIRHSHFLALKPHGLGPTRSSAFFRGTRPMCLSYNGLAFLSCFSSRQLVHFAHYITKDGRMLINGELGVIIRTACSTAQTRVFRLQIRRSTVHWVICTLYKITYMIRKCVICIKLDFLWLASHADHCVTS
jgi:hypothetical protein